MTPTSTAHERAPPPQLSRRRRCARDDGPGSRSRRQRRTRSRRRRCWSRPPHRRVRPRRPRGISPVRSPGAQAPYEPAGLMKTQSSSSGASSTSMTRVASPSSASALYCSGISPSTKRGAPGAGRSELNPPTCRYRAPASADSRASSRYTSTSRPAMSPRGARLATTASAPGMTCGATASAVADLVPHPLDPFLRLGPAHRDDLVPARGGLADDVAAGVPGASENDDGGHVVCSPLRSSGLDCRHNRVGATDSPLASARSRGVNSQRSIIRCMASG